MTIAKRRLTSFDVARASGVSRATVSYVLNNDPRQTIPPETRERVLKAARNSGTARLRLHACCGRVTAASFLA